MELQTKNINSKIDQLEVDLINCEPVDCPLKHTFIDGMYIREIFMPKGACVTSMVHNTTHPYFVMQGEVMVVSENDGDQLITAPFHGTTMPNTRRALFILKDTVWITCHATSIQPKGDAEQDVLDAVEEVERTILAPYENQLISGHFQNNVIFKEQLNIKDLCHT
jgi:hypothetical protein